MDGMGQAPERTAEQLLLIAATLSSKRLHCVSTSAYWRQHSLSLKVSAYCSTRPEAGSAEQEGFGVTIRFEESKLIFLLGVRVCARIPRWAGFFFATNDWPSLVAHKLIDYLASDCGKNFSDRRPAFKAVMPMIASFLLNFHIPVCWT